MTVLLDENGKFLSVTGNTCPRGAKYAEQESTLPLRMITAVLPVAGSAVPLSVKTSAPVPKDMIPEIMNGLATNIAIAINAETNTFFILCIIFCFSLF